MMIRRRKGGADDDDFDDRQEDWPPCVQSRLLVLLERGSVLL